MVWDNLLTLSLKPSKEVVGYYKAKQKVHATSLFSIYFLKWHVIFCSGQTTKQIIRKTDYLLTRGILHTSQRKPLLNYSTMKQKNEKMLSFCVPPFVQWLPVSNGPRSIGLIVLVGFVCSQSKIFFSLLE